MKDIRILLVDDHQIVLDGVKALLDDLDGFDRAFFAGELALVQSGLQKLLALQQTLVVGARLQLDLDLVQRDLGRLPVSRGGRARRGVVAPPNPFERRRFDGIQIQRVKLRR